eukprot:TRINITY_DN19819_c1_g2_i2.p1 TRINITY_DN19819_c1_g2~~TRINITY_DN19819_c1_g2_i2.p1  ORF type:complete len:1347 (-),score=352.18 TRINITY_DN19819_c1_g2_i2:115-4155(-)
MDQTQNPLLRRDALQPVSLLIQPRTVTAQSAAATIVGTCAAATTPSVGIGTAGAGQHFGQRVDKFEASFVAHRAEFLKFRKEAQETLARLLQATERTAASSKSLHAAASVEALADRVDELDGKVRRASELACDVCDQQLAKQAEMDDSLKAFRAVVDEELQDLRKLLEGRTGASSLTRSIDAARALALEGACYVSEATVAAGSSPRSSSQDSRGDQGSTEVGTDEGTASPRCRLPLESVPEDGMVTAAAVAAILAPSPSQASKDSVDALKPSLACFVDETAAKAVDALEAARSRMQKELLDFCDAAHVRLRAQLAQELKQYCSEVVEETRALIVQSLQKDALEQAALHEALESSKLHLERHAERQQQQLASLELSLHSEHQEALQQLRDADALRKLQPQSSTAMDEVLLVQSEEFQELDLAVRNLRQWTEDEIGVLCQSVLAGVEHQQSVHDTATVANFAEMRAELQQRSDLQNQQMGAILESRQGACFSELRSELLLATARQQHQGAISLEASRSFSALVDKQHACSYALGPDCDKVALSERRRASKRGGSLSPSGSSLLLNTGSDSLLGCSAGQGRRMSGCNLSTVSLAASASTSSGVRLCASQHSWSDPAMPLNTVPEAALKTLSKRRPSASPPDSLVSSRGRDVSPMGRRLGSQLTSGCNSTASLVISVGEPSVVRHAVSQPSQPTRRQEDAGSGALEASSMPLVEEIATLPLSDTSMQEDQLSPASGSPMTQCPATPLSTPHQTAEQLTLALGAQRTESETLRLRLALASSSTGQPQEVVGSYLSSVAGEEEATLLAGSHAALARNDLLVDTSRFVLTRTNNVLCVSSDGPADELAVRLAGSLVRNPAEDGVSQRSTSYSSAVVTAIVAGNGHEPRSTPEETPSGGQRSATGLRESLLENGQKHSADVSRPGMPRPQLPSPRAAQLLSRQWGESNAAGPGDSPEEEMALGDSEKTKEAIARAHAAFVSPRSGSSSAASPAAARSLEPESPEAAGGDWTATQGARQGNAPQGVPAWNLLRPRQVSSDTDVVAETAQEGRLPSITSRQEARKLSVQKSSRESDASAEEAPPQLLPPDLEDDLQMQRKVEELEQLQLSLRQQRHQQLMQQQLLQQQWQNAQPEDSQQDQQLQDQRPGVSEQELLAAQQYLLEDEDFVSRTAAAGNEVPAIAALGDESPGESWSDGDELYVEKPWEKQVSAKAPSAPSSLLIPAVGDSPELQYQRAPRFAALSLHMGCGAAGTGAASTGNATAASSAFGGSNCGSARSRSMSASKSTSLSPRPPRALASDLSSSLPTAAAASACGVTTTATALAAALASAPARSDSTYGPSSLANDRGQRACRLV